ncbi:hypothetical protein EV401DRAFT_2064141 [Pisolithus croceorrhizus]|nr:hypothetical protein EV401DRAFT_2064141 [Pisolithus croceorrhizus]
MILLSPPLPATLLLLPRSYIITLIPFPFQPQPACCQPAEAQNHIFDSLEERHGARIIPGQNLSRTVEQQFVFDNRWHDLDDPEMMLTIERETNVKWKFVLRETLGVLEMLVQADEVRAYFH